MTSGLKEKIARALGLVDALRIIASDPQATGAIKISSGEVKGALAFARGKLVGAFVNRTGERGQEALEKLAGLNNVAVKYAKFDESAIAPAERIDIEVVRLIKELVVQGRGGSTESEAVTVEIRVNLDDLFGPRPVGASVDEETTAVPAFAVQEAPALSEGILETAPEAPAPSEGILGTAEALAPAVVAEPIEEHAEPAVSDQEVEVGPPEIEAKVEEPQAVVAQEPVGQSVEPAVSEPVIEPAPAAAVAEAPDEPEAQPVVEEPAAAQDTAAKDEAESSGAASIAAALAQAETVSAESAQQSAEPSLLSEDASVIPPDTRADGIPKAFAATIAAEEREEFEKVRGVFERPEESLTPDQRKLLDDVSVNLSDEESFREAHPQLETVTSDHDLTESQLDLLSNAPLDDKSFHQADKHIEWDIPSLSDDQRKLLKTLEKEARDLESFEELTGFLEDKGLQLTADQLWELGEVMFARTQQEQKDEFVTEDEKLKIPEQAELYNFVEPEAPPPPVAEDLEAIPEPEVTDADRAPLVTAAEAPELPKIKERKGIIGRVSKLVGIGYTGKRRRRRSDFPLAKAIGMSALVLLCVGIFTVPAMIRSTAATKTSDQLAEEQLRIAVQEELSEDRPSAVEASNNTNSGTSGGGGSSGSSSGGGGGGGASGGSDSGSSLENDQLGYARSLVAEGKVGNALPYFEDYVNHNSSAVAVKVELIRCYLAAKKRAKARLLCINALKQKLTDAEIATIWGLLRSCLDG